MASFPRPCGRRGEHPFLPIEQGRGSASSRCLGRSGCSALPVFFELGENRFEIAPQPLRQKIFVVQSSAESF